MSGTAWTARDAAERLARALGSVGTKEAMLAVMAEHLTAALYIGRAQGASRRAPVQTGSDLAGRLTADDRHRLAGGPR